MRKNYTFKGHSCESRNLLCTILLAIIFTAACHESGAPMGQNPSLEGLGGSGNIVVPPSLNCATGMVQYGNSCVPNVIPVVCPTASGEYKFISAFDPKEDKETVDLSASLMPAPTKRFGGRIRAVAAYEGFKLWSYGSTLFASDAAGKQTTQELFSVINSIAVKKLADGSVLVAAGTRQNLQTFTLNISDGTLTPLAVFGKFGEIASVAIANSIDHIKQSIPKETQPSEGVDVSVNLPESKDVAASGSSAISATSDYIYLASAAGLYRIQPSMAGGGCVEEVWKPADASVRIVKIAAEGNYAAVLNETSTDEWKNLSTEDKNLYFKTMSDIKNADFAFAFNHLLWPDKVYRNAMTISLADGAVSNHKSGIISDITINGGNTYVSAADSDVAADWCPNSCAQKASIDALTLLVGTKPLNIQQQISGTIYKYNLPSGNETQLDMPNTSVTSPTGIEFLKTWHPIFNRLASGTDGAYAWGSYGYIIKLEETPKLIPTNGFNAASFSFPPLQIAQNTDKLIGVFEADTEGTALITSDTKSIATNGLKPLTIKTSSSNELLFTNKIGNKMYAYSLSGNTPKQVTAFDNMVNPVALDKSTVFSASAQSYDSVFSWKHKIVFSTDQSTKTLDQQFGSNDNFVRDIKFLEDNKILLLSNGLVEKDIGPTEFYYVYIYTFKDGNIGSAAFIPSLDISATSMDKNSKFLITLETSNLGKLTLIKAGDHILRYQIVDSKPMLTDMGKSYFNDVAADYVNGKKNEAIGIALISDNKLIFFSLKVDGITPFPQNSFSFSAEKPLSTKLAISGQTAYLLANFSPTDQRLYKIKIQDNKLQIEQTYTGTNFRDIAMKDGKLVAASRDNGVEFYE